MANPKKLGRPSLGDTRKVSLTLPPKIWMILDGYDTTMSKTLRDIIINSATQGLGEWILPEENDDKR